MSTWSIRPLKIEDAADAAALILAAFAAQDLQTDPPSSALRETPATIADKIGGGGGVCVAAEADVLGLILWQADGDGLYCGRLAVRPDMRNRGIARRLIAAAEAEAGRRRLARLNLKARLALTTNRRLFESCGFVQTGVECHAGYRTPTTVVMEKRVAHRRERLGDFLPNVKAL